MSRPGYGSLVRSDRAARRTHPRKARDGAPHATAQDDGKYTDPDLRGRIKEELQAGDEGGRAGQWSARKSQMLVQEYERRGGGYRGGRTGQQEDLERWTEEDWQTADGSTDARHRDRTERYLPKEGWDRRARQDAQALPIDGYEDLTAREVTRRLSDPIPVQLRRVGDFERDHAGRKTVLEAVDRAERRAG